MGYSITYHLMYIYIQLRDSHITSQEGPQLPEYGCASCAAASFASGPYT